MNHGARRAVAATRPDGRHYGWARLGFRYFFRRSARRQLAHEIRAQFAAFAATGLTLDHANAHKHMQVHPTVGKLMIETGREFGLRSVRIPAEPPTTLRLVGTPVGLGDRALHAWTRLLRHQARAAGMSTNDHCFGLAWSGHMTTERVRRLLDHLPDGVSEIYFHPATERDPVLARLMPDYEQEAEHATLLDRELYWRSRRLSGRTEHAGVMVGPGCHRSSS